MTGPRPSTLVCDVGSVAPDATTVDALARLQLTTGDAGLSSGCVMLRRVDGVARVHGLAEVLRVEPGGQPEQREQRLGVEKNVNSTTPPAETSSTASAHGS